jgi:Fur family ferric uptake transcriptional regulator
MTGGHWELVLRDHGCRVTVQRVAILGALAELRHPTVEAIHEHLRSAEPALNLSTVYRTLSVLEDAGIVTHAHIGARGPVYHLAAEAPHLHLSCLGCGRVVSVDVRAAAGLAAEVAAQTGFRIEPAHSAVYGWCAECAADTTLPAGPAAPILGG